MGQNVNVLCSWILNLFILLGPALLVKVWIIREERKKLQNAAHAKYCKALRNRKSTHYMWRNTGMLQCDSDSMRKQPLTTEMYLKVVETQLEQ